MESASKPSNKSTGGANNLTYTPSPQVQNNDTHSNCFNVQNKDVFDLVSNTPTQELGKSVTKTLFTHIQFYLCLVFY